MNKYTKKYRKIVNKLVKKSFPRLKKKLILIISIKYQITWASAMVIYFGFGAWIIVFPKSRNYSQNDLESLFAHELSHYELILHMSFFEKIKFAFKWLFTKKGKAGFGTAADKYAIKKGYGKSLYGLVVFTEQKRSKEQLAKRKSRGYLSSKEIKFYAKKIGRW